MELVEAILGRRSVDHLIAPAPNDDEVTTLVRMAANAPDHGKLRPWRLILVRGDARQAIGQALADVLGPDDETGRARMAAKPLRAPLLLSIIFAPQDHPRIPEWEQLAAAAAMVQNLMLLLHGSGWDSMWRTGEASRAEPIRKLLRLEPTETALGWLYVGTSTAQPARPARPEWDPRRRLSMFCGDDIVPLVEGGVNRPKGASAKP